MQFICGILFQSPPLFNEGGVILDRSGMNRSAPFLAGGERGVEEGRATVPEGGNGLEMLVTTGLWRFVDDLL